MFIGIRNGKLGESPRKGRRTNNNINNNNNNDFLPILGLLQHKEYLISITYKQVIKAIKRNSRPVTHVFSVRPSFKNVCVLIRGVCK
jgi:hypothetical protein